MTMQQKCQELRTLSYYECKFCIIKKLTISLLELLHNCLFCKFILSVIMYNSWLEKAASRYEICNYKTLNWILS